ncbi:hypothetical protein RE628_03030 [Paenibacillus sp. D2_2]|uniref:hypothetical protein n=1 Tax=Paenibacillus sp. D2_2 TaxID=3073092 RepID=UPI002816998F|nr:hypothetical protein [Paenibacillus sp. D2_2]WMT41529.1 hypothetical protein RE628_03030 [Paenibacillus sp. D2_2]
MVKFLKINGISAIYGLLFAILADLMLNIYRLARLIEIEVGKMGTIINWSALLILAVASFSMYWLTKLQLGCGGVLLLTSILWLPYAVGFMYVFATLLPITDRRGSFTSSGTYANWSIHSVSLLHIVD